MEASWTDPSASQRALPLAKAIGEIPVVEQSTSPVSEQHVDTTNSVHDNNKIPYLNTLLIVNFALFRVNCKPAVMNRGVPKTVERVRK